MALLSRRHGNGQFSVLLRLFLQKCRGVECGLLFHPSFGDSSESQCRSARTAAVNGVFLLSSGKGRRIREGSHIANNNSYFESVHQLSRHFQRASKRRRAGAKPFLSSVPRSQRTHPVPWLPV